MSKAVVNIYKSTFNYRSYAKDAASNFASNWTSDKVESIISPSPVRINRPSRGGGRFGGSMSLL